jgi:hypothetical protein
VWWIRVARGLWALLLVCHALLLRRSRRNAVIGLVVLALLPVALFVRQSLHETWAMRRAEGSVSRELKNGPEWGSFVGLEGGGHRRIAPGADRHVLLAKRTARFREGEIPVAIVVFRGDWGSGDSVRVRLDTQPPSYMRLPAGKVILADIGIDGFKGRAWWFPD